METAENLFWGLGCRGEGLFCKGLSLLGMNKGRLKNIQTTFWFAGIFINEN